MDPQLLNSIGGFELLLPLSHFVISWILSRVFRVPFWLCLIMGALPSAMLYLDVPFSATLQAEHPFTLLAGGWVLVGAFAFTVFLARGLNKLLAIGSGSVSSFFSLLLVVCLVGATFVLVKPDWLVRMDPAWQGGFAALLFTFCTLGLVISCFRFLRAGAVIALWAFAAFVLGSETFLGSVPSEYLSRELASVRSFIPSSVIGDFVDTLEDVEISDSTRESSRDRTRITVFGSEDWVADPNLAGPTFSEQIELLLNTRSGSEDFEVVTVSAPDVGMLQIRDEISERAKDRPNGIYVVGGWLHDSAQGENAFGIPGIGEIEALNLIDKRKWLASFPLMASLLDSKVLRMFVDPTEFSLPGKDVPSPRLRVEEYQNALVEIAEIAQNANAKLLFLHQPVLSVEKDTEKKYRSALTKVAKRFEIPVVDPTQMFRRYGFSKLFTDSSTSLSAKGHRMIAEAIIKAMVPPSGSELRTSKLTEDLFAKVSLPYEDVVSGNDLSGELLFDVAVDPQYKGFYRVRFAVNDEFVSDKRLNRSEPTRLRFKVPRRLHHRPYLKLGLSASKEQSSGEEEITPPVPITVSSKVFDGYQEVGILTPLPQAIDWDWSNAHLAFVSMDIKSGKITRAESLSWDQDPHLAFERLASLIRAVDWGSLVVISSAAIPVDINSESLNSALQYLAVDETLKVGERFVLVASAGTGKKPVMRIGRATQTVKLSAAKPLAIQILKRHTVASVPMVSDSVESELGAPSPNETSDEQLAQGNTKNGHKSRYAFDISNKHPSEIEAG